MFETTRYEGRQRFRGAVALTVLLALFALLIIYIFPSIAESTADIDALIEALPESFQEGLGAETYTTIEGFVAAELYQFVWLLLLGLYVAYAAGGTVADDVESGRIYLLLATSISRARLVFEKACSLVVPIGMLSLVMPLVVFGGTLAIGYPIDPYYLTALHVLSLPYFLVCAGIGLGLSVTVDRGDVAQRGAIAVVFLLFLLESVTAGTDYEWLGTVSPSRYIDPTEILVDETLVLGDAVLLFATSLVLLAGSLWYVQQRDV